MTHMRRIFFVFLVLNVAGVTACGRSEPMRHDGTPIPAGTPIIEHAPVSSHDRAGPIIDLKADLVVNEPQEGVFFERPIALAVDTAERIYVLDSGSHTVYCLDGDGRLLWRAGGEGTGPGELSQPLALAVIGDMIIVADESNRRLVQFDTEGNHIRDIAQVPRIPGEMVGTPHGVVGIWIGAPDRLDSLTFVFGALTWATLESRPLYKPFVELLEYHSPSVTRALPSGGTVTVALPITMNTARFATTSKGPMFITSGREYEVLALELTGEYSWILRVPTEPSEITNDDLRAALELSSEVLPGGKVSEVEWFAEREHPALYNVEVDASGNLYVFPYVYVPRARPFLGDFESPRQEPPGFPVDVYSTGGELLLNGSMPIQSWAAARGDHIYRIELGRDDGEWRVARYKLLTPF